MILTPTSIQMSHWRHTMVDGAKFWISFYGIIYLGLYWLYVIKHLLYLFYRYVSPWCKSKITTAKNLIPWKCQFRLVYRGIEKKWNTVKQSVTPSCVTSTRLLKVQFVTVSQNPHYLYICSLEYLHMYVFVKNIFWC